MTAPNSIRIGFVPLRKENELLAYPGELIVDANDGHIYVRNQAGDNSTSITKTLEAAVGAGVDTTEVGVAQGHILTGAAEIAKKLALQFAPMVPGAVELKIIGAPAQANKALLPTVADYEVIADLDSISGWSVSWDGLGLDGQLEEGDAVEIVYGTEYSNVV
jgi:hypothetical protein